MPLQLQASVDGLVINVIFSKMKNSFAHNIGYMLVILFSVRKWTILKADRASGSSSGQVGVAVGVAILSVYF